MAADMRADASAARPRNPVADGEEYVWELPVRLAHWTLVFTIVILAVTGYYLHRPFIRVGADNLYLLATVRYVHEVTAFVFTSALLVRLYWGFVGNRHARWGAFFPVDRDRLTRLGRTLQFYVLYRRRPPRESGHNPLAGLFYLGVFALLASQAITGFALFSRVYPREPWTTLFGWVFRIAPVQEIRMLHFLVLFLLAAFVIHHVYSAVLWDAEERNGLLSSMVTGFKRRTPPRAPDADLTPWTWGYWWRRWRTGRSRERDD